MLGWASNMSDLRKKDEKRWGYWEWCPERYMFNSVVYMFVTFIFSKGHVGHKKS